MEVKDTKWILLSFTLSQHNLISDLATMNVWDLFIQVHWGSWGKSPRRRARPPSTATLPSCHVCTQPDDRVINDWARGAIENFWWLYTKAITLVTLAPGWKHLVICCWPAAQAICAGQMCVCLLQTEHGHEISRSRLSHYSGIFCLLQQSPKLSIGLVSASHAAEALYNNSWFHYCTAPINVCLLCQLYL